PIYIPYGTKIKEAAMELYFAPLACSMATRVTLYETGATARFHYVDLRAKRVADGTNFLEVNPLGQVPVLRTDTGELLTENQVILQYVADRHPEAGMAPGGEKERYRLQLWLSFIATELHKAVFFPLLAKSSPEDAKAFARQTATSRLAHLDRHLDGRTHLLDRFTVADAYLATVLNWSVPTRIDLAEWPAVQAYHRRIHQQPSFAKAFAEERALYAEEQARHAAA